ncbi:MAG: hypothetical protein EOP48_03515 [Sphingobacteriales bacterium]|nr:MAG: hypothetical protein EOP48_03515 [Sphingobacteriales bacterium]
MKYTYQLKYKDDRIIIFGIEVTDNQGACRYLIAVSNIKNLSTQQITRKIDTSLFQYACAMPYFDPVRFLGVAESYMRNLHVSIEIKKSSNQYSLNP